MGMVTWDPNLKPTTITLSEDNNRGDWTSGDGLLYSTIGKTTGKWYAEFVLNSSQYLFLVGIAPAGVPTDTYFGSGQLACPISGGTRVYGEGSWRRAGFQAVVSGYNPGSYYGTPSLVCGEPSTYIPHGSVLSILWDYDARTMQALVDGSPWGTLVYDSLVDNGEEMFLVAGGHSNGPDVTLRTSVSEFSYPVPEGFQPYEEEFAVPPAPKKVKDIQYSVNGSSVTDLTLLSLGATDPGRKTVTATYTGCHKLF